MSGKLTTEESLRQKPACERSQLTEEASLQEKPTYGVSRLTTQARRFKAYNLSLHSPPPINRAQKVQGEDNRSPVTCFSSCSLYSNSEEIKLPLAHIFCIPQLCVCLLVCWPVEHIGFSTGTFRRFTIEISIVKWLLGEFDPPFCFLLLVSLARFFFKRRKWWQRSGGDCGLMAGPWVVDRSFYWAFCFFRRFALFTCMAKRWVWCFSLVLAGEEVALAPTYFSRQDSYSLWVPSLEGQRWKKCLFPFTHFLNLFDHPIMKTKSIPIWSLHNVRSQRNSPFSRVHAFTNLTRDWLGPCSFLLVAGMHDLDAQRLLRD